MIFKHDIQFRFALLQLTKFKIQEFTIPFSEKFRKMSNKHHTVVFRKVSKFEIDCAAKFSAPSYYKIGTENKFKAKNNISFASIPSLYILHLYVLNSDCSITFLIPQQGNSTKSPLM